MFFGFASSVTRLRRQLPINILNKQAKQVWQNFIRGDISISIEYMQDVGTDATLFSAYGGSSDEMSLLFEINSSTKTNKITIKFRTDKERIKSYVMTTPLSTPKMRKLIFALDESVVQLSVDCNQLIKAMDRHLSFQLKQNQTQLKIFLGNSISEHNTFKGTTRQYVIERGNPIYSACKEKLKVVLSQPIKTIIEEDDSSSHRTAKHQFAIEMIARHGLELEKNVNHRLQRLEDEMQKWQDLLNKLETKIQFLENLNSKTKRNSDHKKGKELSCNGDYSVHINLP